MNYLDNRLPGNFWDKTTPEPNSGCWLWLGAKNDNGYGMFGGRGNVRRAHRVALAAVSALVPDLVIDHKCRQRCCVNPGHMEQVTRVENVLRGFGYSGRNKRKTHCPHGHAYSADNTRVATNKLTGRKSRFCMECLRIYNSSRSSS